MYGSPLAHDTRGQFSDGSITFQRGESVVTLVMYYADTLSFYGGFFFFFFLAHIQHAHFTHLSSHSIRLLCFLYNNLPIPPFSPFFLFHALVVRKLARTHTLSRRGDCTPIPVLSCAFAFQNHSSQTHLHIHTPLSDCTIEKQTCIRR